MMIDIPQERGMAFADYRFGDPSECRFPLFNGLTHLSVDWMYVVYLIMYIGKQVPWPYTSVWGLDVCGVSHHVHR